MRLCISLVILASIACSENVHETSGHSAYGYLQKYGIPRAEQICMAEEKLDESRIVGGLPAGVEQYPFQAGLIADIIGLDSRSVCGGSLLTTSLVLTAAHCWSDGTNQVWRFTIVLGSIYLFSGGIRIESSEVALHPNWSPILARNDVAVIYLPNAVTLSNLIGTVALPTGSQEDESFAGESAIAVGFGITSDDGGISSNQSLSHVRLNVINNSVCFIAYPLYLQSSHLCTSGIGGVSVCSGDSGGPLIINRDGNTVLIGIASFVSSLGCESNMPAAFCRVTSFLEFIRSHL